VAAIGHQEVPRVKAATDVEGVLDKVSQAFSAIPGVLASTLGGSRASGLSGPASDIDVGIYYDDANRPPFADLLAIANTLDDRGRIDGYGAYGQWGPWVDGGFWTRVDGQKVDILLRSDRKVDRCLDECLRGNTRIEYQVGHPHGYTNAHYLGEVALGVILDDPTARIRGWKARLDPYPKRLADALRAQFIFEADFSLHIAEAAAARGDSTHVYGCIYRTIACLNQVLFAVNGVFLINEKGATAAASELPRAPISYGKRVNAIFNRHTASADLLLRALADAQALVGEVRSLTSDG
jgi:hypothetical protein